MKEYTPVEGTPTLQDLHRAADEARERVSAMSWDERLELRQRAKVMIMEARDKRQFRRFRKRRGGGRW